MFVKMFMPVILDIPYYLKNDFEIITGYARDNANGQGNIRHVTIINEKNRTRDICRVFLSRWYR